MRLTLILIYVGLRVGYRRWWLRCILIVVWIAVIRISYEPAYIAYDILAASLGNSEARYSVGSRFLHPPVALMSEPFVVCDTFLYKLGIRSVLRRRFLLRILFFYGNALTLTSADPARGRSLIGPICEKGDQRACSSLGDYYYYYSQPRNYAEAIDFYTKSCKLGDKSGIAGGCSNLRLLAAQYLQEYGIAEGIPKDEALGARIYATLCDIGDNYSCARLGVLYEMGVGVARDYAQALHFDQKACDGSILLGCAKAGLIYQDALGVERNYAQARTLYEKACYTRSGYGCSLLGNLYELGMGVTKDYSQARVLYLKACDHAEQEGCYRAGLIYRNGLGVERDSERARVLFEKACRLGNCIGLQ
jgi:uncharacterized protein